MTFRNSGIIEPILKALHEEGYTHPTPIQEQAIPILLKGKDLLGCAQTGTGKTAAFAIPILQHLYLENFRNRDQKKTRALIVTPTRELAIQIGDSFTNYGRFTGISNTVIYGGVKQGTQVQSLAKGVDVLVATPGRLLDLMGQGFISLDNISYFVLDEADRMLDMGFIHDIRKIIARLPEKRQSLFFSATMPPEIVELSRKILGNPEKVTIRPEQTTAEKVEQSVIFVSKAEKPALLIHLLQKDPDVSTLVFSRTKHGADKIVRILKKAGVEAHAIHGNKSQGARQLALNNFKDGKSNVLVATDIAARGIDIEELHLVLNYDLPNIPETYVHRIGRTARAGLGGKAISFCDEEEKEYLMDIQKLIRQTVPVKKETLPLNSSVNEIVKPSKTSGVSDLTPQLNIKESGKESGKFSKYVKNKAPIVREKDQTKKDEVSEYSTSIPIPRQLKRNKWSPIAVGTKGITPASQSGREINRTLQIPQEIQRLTGSDNPPRHHNLPHNQGDSAGKNRIIHLKRK